MISIVPKMNCFIRMNIRIKIHRTCSMYRIFQIRTGATAFSRFFFDWVNQISETEKSNQLKWISIFGETEEGYTHRNSTDEHDNIQKRKSWLQKICIELSIVFIFSFGHIWLYEAKILMASTAGSTATTAGRSSDLFSHGQTLVQSESCPPWSAYNLINQIGLID